MTTEGADPATGDPDDVTLASYEAAADEYVRDGGALSPALKDFLDRLADLVGNGTVLELGSGPGRDALYLEQRGVRVHRTDGAAAFVTMMRGAGHDARQLDVRTGDFGGPHDAVLAQAVLLHLDRGQFGEVLTKARRAVTDSGILAFTVKEGDGSAWSRAKLDRPRHFTYWREEAVRQALASTGWALVSLDHVAGRLEPWLYVVARAAESG